MKKRSAIRNQLAMIGLVLCVLITPGCGIYTLGGASIPANMKTVTVQFFENTALSVVPNLSSKFTEALMDRIRSQSKLSIVRSGGDGNFEGTITDYTIAPTAVQGDNRAGLVRLSITVKVKYTNTLKESDGFEQSFSRYIDFAPPVAPQEQNRINDVNKMLVDDIFNRAFANW